jgi:hypothetical protein
MPNKLPNFFATFCVTWDVRVSSSHHQNSPRNGRKKGPIAHYTKIGYGMEIACVLAGKASEDIIKKVKKSLRSKRKKRVYSWKFPRLLD